MKPIEKKVKNQLLEKIEEIIDDNNDLLRWQREELKEEIEKDYERWKNHKRKIRID